MDDISKQELEVKILESIDDIKAKYTELIDNYFGGVKTGPSKDIEKIHKELKELEAEIGKKKEILKELIGKDC